MTPYLIKFIKTFGYLYFLRKLNEEKESVPTSGLEDDVQGHPVQDRNQSTGRDSVESEILQAEKVQH